MSEQFITFQPKSILLQPYVDYYYLDTKENNDKRAFECYPHFNTTISLYANHIRLPEHTVAFHKEASVLQIFTPIREQLMQVQQIGPVHRLVIVFKPLGIQQFFRENSFADFIYDSPFFTEEETKGFFDTKEITRIQSLLDASLEKRFQLQKFPKLEQAIQLMEEEEAHYSIEEIAEIVGSSRRQLHRNFSKHFGVSIKKFHTIVLFRKALAQKMTPATAPNFTALAYQYFYNDQSHLIKTFKAFTSKTPKQLVQEATLLGTQDTYWKWLD